MAASRPPVPPTDDAPAFPEHSHDHGQCRVEAVRRAETLCTQRGARFTEARRRVLMLLWEDHRPISAYDILHRLNATAGPDSRQLAPQAVYRALEFLIEQGLAHRIESLNAFVGCSCPERPHGAQFFLCHACGTVAEVGDDSITRGIAQAASLIGFSVGAPVIEVSGLCPHCRPAPSDPDLAQ